MGRKKANLFNVIHYIEQIPITVGKILCNYKVNQLTEKQAIQLAAKAWWTTVTADHAMVLQLYMIRQILPIDYFVDTIGCELNKPLSITAIQDYRFTLLNYYRQKYADQK